MIIGAIIVLIVIIGIIAKVIMSKRTSTTNKPVLTSVTKFLFGNNKRKFR